MLDLGNNSCGRSSHSPETQSDSAFPIHFLGRSIDCAMRNQGCHRELILGAKAGSVVAEKMVAVMIGSLTSRV
jgi:hypothetical protein